MAVAGLVANGDGAAELRGKLPRALGGPGVRRDDDEVFIHDALAADILAQQRLCVKMVNRLLKKPCTCGACRSIVTTRSTPTASMQSAHTRARMDTRGSSFLSPLA